MKVTMDYVVGNTAIQIVNTGKKVKIVDVKNRRRKESLLNSGLLQVQHPLF